jgi:hypothetical protein
MATAATIPDTKVSVLMATMGNIVVIIILLLSSNLIVTKNIAQQLLNFIVFVQFCSVEDILQLTFIEPQTVTSAAFVYEQGRFGRTEDNFLHFFVADRAFPYFLIAFGIDSERIEQVFSLVGLVQQKLEFAGIQPDAAAVGAMIDLNVFELKRDHRIFTSWTIHILKLKIQYPEPMSTRRAHRQMPAASAG